MNNTKKAGLIVLILSLCITCDQVTKAIARNHLAEAHPIYLWGDLFLLHYMENTGAFLGWGASLPAPVRFGALIVLVGIVLIGILAFVSRSKEMTPLGRLGGMLIVGGGFSNLIDRILNEGAVIDFMNVGIGKLRTGVFNVADMAIMAGIGLLLVSSLSISHSEEECLSSLGEA